MTMATSLSDRLTLRLAANVTEIPAIIRALFLGCRFATLYRADPHPDASENDPLHFQESGE
jgi:hypothetical protein